MKKGFIQADKSAQELLKLLKQFEDYGVSIENVVINSTFEHFLTTVERGDVVVIDSYTEVFGGLNELLSTLIELSEQEITVESFSEPTLTFNQHNIDILKTILSIGMKVRASRTVKGLDKARARGVKLGRPFGTTKVHSKVEQVVRLRQTQDISVSKACKEVGCNPRTYYRHLHDVKQ